MKKIGILIFAFVMISSSVASAQVSQTPINPHGVSCTYFESNLRYGTRDTRTNGPVINLQAYLRGTGYLQVEPTGFFGKLTVAAVKEFQKNNELPQTGYVGPLTRAKIKKLTCEAASIEGLVITTVTDKQTYASGEPIQIEITAQNTTDKPIELNWSNGCQTQYMIDGVYNSIAAMMCIQSLTTKTIAPHQSFTWNYEHKREDYELKTGTHTISGTVINYGSGSATITVQ